MTKMMDEQEAMRQQAINGWDKQSCAEFEAWLDEVNDEAQEPAEPTCTCYYTDVDVVENRYCEAHGRRKEF